MSIHPRLLAAGASAILAAAGGIAYIFEGEKREVYTDPVGIMTACIGHVSNGLKLGQYFSEQECTTLFISDLGKAAAVVDSCTPTLQEDMKAPMISFAFNVGGKAYCQSTLAKLANAGDLCGACNQLSRWVYAKGKMLPGLVRRREFERQECLKGALNDL